MARVTLAQVAQQLYVALHNVTIEAEAGKPMPEAILKVCQDALDQADRIKLLRTAVYADSHDDRELTMRDVVNNLAEYTGQAVAIMPPRGWAYAGDIDHRPVDPQAAPQQNLF